MIEELKATFEYHPDGYLIRKSTGEPCGLRANHPTGYALVNVGGKLVFAHRIIYAIVHGEMPGEVDHINSNREDNRIENLREVSRPEDSHKKPETDTSGVFWYAPTQKWVARIRVDHQLIHLGYFTDYEDAVEARKMAKIKYRPSSPEAAKFARELSPRGA